MALVINSNIASLTSQRHLSQTRNDMETAMERMSSGSRINSSMDDAAGLAIANRMTSQVEGLNQAIRNANDAISLAQTAEATLDAHSSILQRMRVLSVQAANDTYSALDRKTLNNEILQLKEELNRSVSKAMFNGQQILDGTNTSFTFQIGHTATDTVKVSLANMKGSEIGTQTWEGKLRDSTLTGTANTAPTPDTLTFDLSSKTLVAGDQISVVLNSITYVQDYTTSLDATLTALGTQLEAHANYGSSAAAAGILTISGNADVAIPPPTSFTVKSSVVAATKVAQSATVKDTHSYDFSSIAVVEGDRVSMTVGSNTYRQEFVTDRATTLQALGALVVNGETTYTEKSVASDVLKFTGSTSAGSALASATVFVQAGTVKAADSVDDIIITDSTSAKAALSVVDSALEMMADFRSRMGAMSNRLYHSVDNLMNVSENTAAARSRIEDADFASESANLAKNQVLQQAGTAMLAQANASTKDILSLLK